MRSLLADQLIPTNALGLAAATVAAMLWAIAVVMYRRVGRVMPPVRLNLTKGMFATVVMGAAVLVSWEGLGQEPWAASVGMLVMMAMSGVIGIGLGDTLLFAALNRMGARRMLLLFTTNPVFTAVAAWLILDEPMTMWQVVGVGLTCGGVAWVIAERSAGKADGHVDALGVLCGLGAAGCQSAGVLMSRYAFEHGQFTAPGSAWLRIAAGTVVLCLFLPLDRRLGDPGGEDHQHPARPSKVRAAAMLGGGMLLGTVLGIGLQQTSIKYADNVGVASTLLSTSPLFVLPIAMLLGEHISRRAVLGAAITVAGVAMLYGVS